MCRGRFFTASDPAERAAALADNRTAIDEAAALGTAILVLVSGGVPPGDRDLAAAARERVAEAVAELAPYAGERGVRLAVEPLHPMYASDRCVISTLGQALDGAERFPAAQVGVVVDTYHIGWDGASRRAPGQAPGAVSRASSSRTGSPRFPRACCWAVACWATAALIFAVSVSGWTPRDSPAP